VARFFTADEANAALADVRPLVERMVAHRRAMLAAEAKEEALGARIAGNGGAIDPGEPARAAEAVATEGQAIAEIVDDLAELGVQVKDLDTGLVDFPALRDGEEVLLCWRLGEDEVGWWHRIEDGFAGRRPLPLEDDGS
jgi:hypothetical protein